MKTRMVYNGAGVIFTSRWEGLELKAYKDTGGVWTCGYGHTQGVSPSTVCTKELAESWLRQDTQAAVNAVNNLVKVDLTQNEFNALVDFTFNVGATQFSKSTLLSLLNEGNDKAAAEQFERWKYDNGKVVAGLLRRRYAERDLFLKEDEKE